MKVRVAVAVVVLLSVTESSSVSDGFDIVALIDSDIVSVCDTVAESVAD